MKMQHQTRLRLPSLASVAVAIALCAGSVPARAAPDWDIVGIKLGMTEQQARAAIKARSAQAVAREAMLKFTFSDGAKQQDTASFLARISASIPSAAGSTDSESLELEFSPPPRDQRVIRVRRTMTLYKDPPALDRILGSLSQKYGKPRRFETLGIGEKIWHGAWSETGKALCGGDKRSFITVGQSPDRLKLFHQLQKEKLAPADLSQCGAQMQVNVRYREGGSSVHAMEIEMRNYDYVLPALEATAKWLADQEAAARKARLGSGSTPKL
jgi:hypothetical protein